jgi:Fe-S oxidoreductase
MEGTPAKPVFYLLTLLSLAAMAWQFWQRAKLWRKGQPVRWSQDWLGSVLRYVVGQKKVQGSRPRSGAPMHLMLFYGFLSLFLATTLLAVASYAPLVGLENFHRGGYYLAYETTFDLLGLLFVAGVVWALGRRLLHDARTRQGARPVMASDWRDYATLGILLMLGVTGYLLEAARIVADPKPWDGASVVGYALSRAMPPLGPAGYVGLWWFHYAWFFAFVVFLPQMRLRHIVVATFTAAGSPERPMGRLEPVSMQEVEETGRIGVAEAGHYSRWHLMSLDACMACGRCTEVCPAHGVGKVLNPRQVVADVIRANEAGLGVAESVSEEALWACTTCNACVEACPVLIRHVDLIVDARRNLVAEGRLAGTGATMLRQLASTGHAWGAAGREEWMAGLDVPLCRDGASFEYLLWVGCAGATDPAAVRTTRSLAKLLAKAGVAFACLGDEEACTGDPARRAGDEFLFQSQAGHVAAALQKYGVRKVVTACPHCFNTLRNEYADFGATLEVFHHSQLLASLVEDGLLQPARLALGETTFHDPCYLARVNGVADPPRALLGEPPRLDGDAPALVRAAEATPGGPLALVEPEHHGRKTLCCGAGGARMWMEEEPGQRPSERRVAELLATGAKEVAVACPFCRIMLDASLKQEAGDEVRLVDVAEKLWEANE